MHPCEEGYTTVVRRVHHCEAVLVLALTLGVEGERKERVVVDPPPRRLDAPPLGVELVLPLPA